MKLTKQEINQKAKIVPDDLLCTCGLRDGKKVAMQVKRNLLIEENRRKNAK